MYLVGCATWWWWSSSAALVMSRVSTRGGGRRGVAKHKHRQKHRGVVPLVAAASASALSTSTSIVTTVVKKHGREGGAEVVVDDEGATRDGWLLPLRRAVFREGGTLRCHTAARPDPSCGVRAIKQYWRRGEASSYDEVDVEARASKAVSSAVASKASDKNTQHHVINLRRLRGRRVDDETKKDDGAVTPRSTKTAPGDAHHPVLRALLERKRSGSTPGRRSDGLRIALAVEGGGMRGVISAGATGEILRMGFADCFDVVYGSSAGAMNLTYYLARQPEGVAAYQEDLVGGEFLDLMRIAARSSTSAPAMDVSYLVDGVMDGVTNRGLRWDRIIDSPVPLKVVATSLDTLTPVVLEGPFADVEDLKQCLKASAAVPVFAGAAPVVHRGHRLVDAAVMEPVPVNVAAADGCTHVLVLCTRTLPPPGEGKRGRRRSSSSSSAAAEEKPKREREREQERRRSAAAAAGRAGVGIVSGSAGSGASTLAAAVAARQATEETEQRRMTLFSRIGEFISRRRRQRSDLDALASAREDEVAGSHEGPVPRGDQTGAGSRAAASEASTSRDEKDGIKTNGGPKKAFYGVLYKTIRSALMSPPHMKDAWGVVDATRKLVDADYATDLDEALVLARDDPVAAAATAIFPGGAHVFSISPLAADMPKGVSSLCTDSEVLKVGNRAGKEATNRVLSGVLACLEREEEVSYYVETMCERIFL